MLQPHEHLLEERVLEIWVPVAGLEHDPDHVRPARDQGASCADGREAGLADGDQDPLARLRRDVRIPVQDTRDGGDGDTEL